MWLKTNTASGHDNIITDMLKNNSFVFLKPLSHVFKSSISQLMFPDIFKTAIITPIFEKGDRDKAENYRPILLISNIVEKIMKNNIQKYSE